MFGKSQTGAGHGQCSPSFPRCYTLLPEGQEREGVSALGQMGKCLRTYRKEWEVKNKKEPGEEVRRKEREGGEEVRSPGGREERRRGGREGVTDGSGTRLIGCRIALCSFYKICSHK